MEDDDGAFYAREFMRKLRQYSNDKENPIPEWELQSYVQEAAGECWCICSKEIKNLYHIKSKLSGHLLTIGCDCAKRWIDCDLNCFGCDAPLKSSMTRRRKGDFWCRRCHKMMKRVEDTPVVRNGRLTTFKELALDESFVNRMVNRPVKEPWMVHFVAYCRFFYSWE